MKVGGAAPSLSPRKMIAALEAKLRNKTEVLAEVETGARKMRACGELSERSVPHEIRDEQSLSNMSISTAMSPP